MNTKKLLKKKLIRKTQKLRKEPDLSMSCKSNNEFNTIFQGIDNTYNNIPLIWRVTAVLIFIYGKNQQNNMLNETVSQQKFQIINIQSCMQSSSFIRT